MSEEVLHSYRLSSLEEPSDEMLYAIMQQVAQAARKSSAEAEANMQKMFAEMMANIARGKKLAI